MGWKERRNGNTYYYRSIRRGDKVVTEYHGSGEFAKLAASIAEAEARLARLERLKRRLFIEEWREVERYFRGVETVFRASLAAAGYRRHERGEWRMSRSADGELATITAEVGPKVYTSKEVHEIAARAAQGDETTLTDIAAILSGPKRATLLQHIGNPAYLIRAEIVNRIAGKNLLAREAISAKAVELEASLTPPDPTPIEQLLAERVVVSWLAVHDAEGIEIEGRKYDTAPATKELQQRRVDRAHARFLAAAKALETARRLSGKSGSGATTVSMSRTERLTVRQEAPSDD